MEEIESKISMKMVIDTHGKTVLFAEVGNDCVDLLFSIVLSLPLEKQGSVSNLYESVKSLDQPKEEKLPVAPLHAKSRAVEMCCKYLSDLQIKDEDKVGVGGGNYYLMDDLVVKPVFTFSAFNLHRYLESNGKINSAVALEEKVVHLGKTEAVELMKISLVSNNVLTKFFFNANTNAI